MNICSIHIKIDLFYFFCYNVYGDYMDIFCKIINGEIPSYTIYEDDIVKVLLDVNPKADGHTLIIPKKHYLDLDDIDMDTLNHILSTAKKIKLLLEEKLSLEGIMLVQNNGTLEEVKHFHLHLIPPFAKSEDEISDIKDVYEKLTK